MYKTNDFQFNDTCNFFFYINQSSKFKFLVILLILWGNTITHFLFITLVKLWLRATAL